jgi:alkaline phosphatase D
MTTYSRRDMLRILSISASATALGLAGCHNGGDNNPPAQGFQPGGQTLAGDAYFAQGVASGDPRQTSVILWTRVEDAAASGDVRVRLQVALDEGFANRVVDRTLDVRAADDRVLKVRVTGLAADQRYFYRYTYLRSDRNFYLSPVGRTRTAPEITSTRAVRFAFVSCQDYIGRFYNTLLPLLDQDLDFVVHLGDAIYETTGDPLFQGGAASRAIRFDDELGAIRLGSATAPFFAAQSLDNYRQLHRTYRADAVLKQVYQRFPVVAIWDDHEYSDDAWMSVATYTDGRRDERDDARRRNADRAWFEYMPIDTEVADGNGVLSVSDRQLFPNARIFRSFRFGRDVELFLTDYRSFRPDHLIPEDAFPGTVVMDRAALTQVLALGGVSYDAVRGNFSAYVNVDAGPFAPYKAVLLAVLTLAYQAEGIEIAQASVRAQNTVRGNIATTVINSLVAQFNAQVPPAQRVPPISDAVIATLDTGIAYFTLGKTTLFGDLGARYFVVKDTYDLYATYLLLTRGAQVQSAYGATQDQWLRSQVAASTARWKFVGSSVSFTSMVLDLRPPQLGVPAPLNQRFYLNVDQWDGFPNQKAQYLAQVLGPIPGVVLLSGDIHASFGTQHGPNVVEFTTPAISSSTFKSLLASSAASDPLLAPLASALLPALDNLLRAANASIRYVQSERHGVAVATADASAVTVSFTELPETRATTSAYAAPASINADLRTTRLRYDGAALTVLASVAAAVPALDPELEPA